MQLAPSILTRRFVVHTGAMADGRFVHPGGTVTSCGHGTPRERPSRSRSGPRRGARAHRTPTSSPTATSQQRRDMATCGDMATRVGPASPVSQPATRRRAPGDSVQYACHPQPHTDRARRLRRRSCADRTSEIQARHAVPAPMVLAQTSNAAGHPRRPHRPRRDADMARSVSADRRHSGATFGASWRSRVDNAVGRLRTGGVRWRRLVTAPGGSPVPFRDRLNASASQPLSPTRISDGDPGRSRPRGDRSRGRHLARGRPRRTGWRPRRGPGRPRSPRRALGGCPQAGSGAPPALR